MRAKFFLAGLVVVAAACGKKGGEQAADTTAMAPAPSTETPAATTGTAHDVNMELDGSTYKFEPAALTIKSGDVVRFHNTSGGPHNVSFYTDSIPAGAAAALNAGMADQTAALSGPLLVEANAVYTVSFAGAPAGTYKFYCLPHTAMGMKGTITVQ